MTREIKFRAWDLGRMYPKCMAGTDTNPTVHDSNGWVECTENAKIMQYTGLKDKNGKEIYEGDIVNCYDDRYDGYEKNVIGYSTQYARFTYLDRMKEIGYYAEMEIIGNIYENPELLENQ